MKQERDQLRTKVLDQTNQEIMVDIRRANQEIKNLKKSHEVMNEEVKMLKACQDDTVPWNVRGKQFDLWNCILTKQWKVGLNFARKGKIMLS